VSVYDDALRIIAPGVGASFATNLVPDLNAEGITGYIPGVSLGQRILGFGGQLYDAGASMANSALGTQLPMAPKFFEDQGNRAAATEELLYNKFGGVQPETPAQEYMKTGASGAGGMMFPGMGPTSLLKFGMLGSGLATAQTAALGAIQPATDAPPPVDPATMTPEDRAQAPMTPGTEPAYSEIGQSKYSFGEAAVVVAGALIGIKTGKRIANHGATVSAAARAARAIDPEFQKEVSAYNDSVVKRTASGVVSDVDAPQPPMPSANLVNTFLTKSKEWGLDASEGAQNLIRLTGDNPRATERLAKQIASTFDEQLWETKNRQFLMTGHDVPSNVSIPNPLAWVHDAERLGKAKFQLFNDTIAARDEMNNRVELAKQRAARGEPPNPVEDRHNFYRQDATELNTKIAAGMADVRIAELVNRHDQIHNGLLDIAEKRGYISTADKARIKQAHPNYLPEGDVEGRIRQTFGPRQVAPRGGIELMNTKVTSLMSQHIEALMRDIEMNDMQRAVKEHIVRYQTDTPGAPKYLYKAVAPNPLVAHQAPYPTLGKEAVSPREQIITVRTPTGMEHWRTDSPMLYDILTSQNATRAKIHFDSAGKWRQMLQAGTTGAASLTTGRIVPLRNIVYTAFQAPANAVGGMYGGPVSALTRGRLPKTLTAPLDAPLNVVGALGQYGINWVSRNITYRAADAFRPENPNTLTQTIRAIVGDAPLRALSNSLMERYKNSTFYEGQSGGLGGQSLQQRIRMPVYGRPDTLRTIRLQMAQLEPSVLINMDGQGSARPFMIKLHRATTDAFTHASEATHDFLYSLNKNNPAFRGDKNQAVQAVRSVVGDPSVSGIGKIPQMVRTHIPYSNVAVQGTRALGRAIAVSPFDTMGAMITSYGGLATLSLLTAFQSQNNLLHFTTEVSSADRGTYMHIYNGSDAENSLIRIPIPAEGRWAYTLMSDAFYHLLAIAGAPHDGDTFDAALSFLKDMWYHQIDKTTIEGLKHNINDAFNFVDFPPYIKAGLALAGGTGRVDFARIINDYQTGNLGMNSLINKPMPTSPGAGMSVNDTVAHGQQGKMYSELASSIFGLAGVLATYAFKIPSYMNQGHSFYDSLGAVVDEWQQGAKDFNPQGNTLVFKNSVALSRNPPVVEQTRRAVREMQKTEGARTGERALGVTNSGRNALEIPMYGNEQGKIPDDPIMAHMFQVTSVYMTQLNRVYMPQINAIEKQIKEVDAKMMNPQERREWVSQRRRDVSDKWRAVADVVQELNSQLSNIAGTPVDLHKGIDWYGDPNQFRR